MWLARGQSGTNYPYVYVIDDDDYYLWGVTNGQKPSGARLIYLTAGDTFMFDYDNYIAADENYAEMCFVRLGVARMSYTTPEDKSVGDLISASDWNAAITENFKASVPDVFTTKGDLAAATAANAVARVAKADDDYFLVSDGGASAGVRWADAQVAVYARYNFSGDFSVVAPYIILNFDSKITDMGGTGDTVTVGTGWKFTAPITGIYAIACLTTKTSGSSTTDDQLVLRKDGNYYKQLQVVAALPASGLMRGAAFMYMEAASYFTVRYYASANVTLQATEGRSHIAIARVY